MIKECPGFTARERQSLLKYVDDLSGCIGSSERIVQTPGRAAVSLGFLFPLTTVYHSYHHNVVFSQSLTPFDLHFIDNSATDVCETHLSLSEHVLPHSPYSTGGRVRLLRGSFRGDNSVVSIRHTRNRLAG